MPFADDQNDLIDTIITALHGWQDTAATVNVVLQQITMVLPTPEGEDPRVVMFTWSETRDQFDIRS